MSNPLADDRFSTGCVASPPDVVPIQFTGSTKELFVLYARTLLYTVLTLGLYAFWGKTAIRRYLWGHTVIAGDPLEYTGTGWELFRSFVIALTILSVGVIAVAALAVGYGRLEIFLAVVAAMIPLFHLGVFQTVRYRLTRTRWRGIRASLRNTPWRYAVVASGYTILTIFSCGLLYPLQTGKLLRLRIQATVFGNLPFTHAETIRNLYRSLILHGGIGILLGVVACVPSRQELLHADAMHYLFLPAGITLWYWLAMIPMLRLAWLFSSLSVSGLTSNAPGITWRANLRVILPAILACVCTLGLAWPWAATRVIRFFTEQLTITGTFTPETVTQPADSPKAFGEGVADALILLPL